MGDIPLEVVVDVDYPTVIKSSICFETGATKNQLSAGVYNHHDLDCVSGALTCFYEDLVQGKALPLRFATRSIGGVDTILAIALFMHRELLVQPATLSFVSSVDLTHRYPNMYGHISSDVSRFIKYLDEYIVQPKGLTKTELGERLTQCLQWIREYLLEDKLPHLGKEDTASVRVIDFGTNGFVLAEAEGSLSAAWEELYRRGYLRGLVVTPDVRGRRHVMASRKTTFNDLDTKKAVQFLNELEYASGEIPDWTSTELSVHSPPDGTVLLVSQMVEVLVRV